MIGCAKWVRLMALLFVAIGRTATAVPPPGFVQEVLLSGLATPISVAFLPDGRMLILQRAGQILIADPNADPIVPAPYMTIEDINSMYQRGLFDITLDPEFSSNGFFYLYYYHGTTLRFRISRFTHTGDTGDLSSEVLLWEYDGESSAGTHFGGGLDFGPDGRIYLTTGEEFDSMQAQDLTRSGGKIIRINADGSIPCENPFVDGAGPNIDSIWAYGLRNPFRARWDLPTARFFIGEVGGNDQETAWEDVHLGQAGANYGWPLCEGPCGNPDYDEAIFAYPHLGENAAIIGGPVYRGSQFPPCLVGAYFYGDYSRCQIRVVTFDASSGVSGDFDFDPAAGNVLFIDEGPDGALYYTTLSGTVRRISGDGTIGIDDLLLLLATWGPCPDPCPADVNDDNDVGIQDLLFLLGNWGMVPQACKGMAAN